MTEVVTIWSRVGAAALLLALYGDATAQRIPDTPICAACRIEAELIAVLGEVDGPAALANVSRVAVDRRGRY